ncbi:type II secretion system F family protein [Roseateles sp. BYS78W]|uniref:General secretion pathway protein F n=1 Tax=Pelomonas candidula TaxID=3299025 RepID=A0ABW7HIP1_9BURK
MRFHLDVVRGRGAPQSMEFDAASPEDARRLAIQQGYSVLALRTPAFDWEQVFRPLRGRPPFETLVFAEQVRDLLGAGLSLIEALDTLERAAAARHRPVLSALVERLRAGARLSDALSLDARFPTLLVALVRASELTSDLPQALTRFLEHEQRVAELRHRITSAIIYPLLLTFVGAGVLLFLLLYVMPRFARVFEGMTGELPWSARAMVGWSHWLHADGPWLAAATGLLAVAVAAAVLTPAFRVSALQRLLDSAPLRDRLRTYFLARWYRATGMLVSGGIPLPEALALSSELLPSALRAGGRTTEQAVRHGLAPAEAHALAGMITTVSEQLMRAGEQTGDMGSVLTRIAQFHDAEVERSLERGLRMLEPVVMVLIGIGVGTVVVLMYMPIFDLAGTIQ